MLIQDHPVRFQIVIGVGALPHLSHRPTLAWTTLVLSSPSLLVSSLSSPSKMRLVWPLVAFALLPSAKAQQQVIECGVPKRMGDGIRPTYDSGEVVPMQWKSTWPLFNLTIVQVSSATQVKFRDQVFRT